jgi:hypothetical protein
MEPIPNNLSEHPRCYNCGITMTYKGTVGSLVDNNKRHRFESECPHQTMMHFTMSGDKCADDYRYDDLQLINEGQVGGLRSRVQKRAIEYKVLETLDSELDYTKGYIDALKSLNPGLVLTYGYIGNLRTTGPIEGRDDRHWRLWCHSGGVREWYIKEDPRWHGHEPYWHRDMTFTLGRTHETEERLTQVIRDGSLVKWIKNMSYRYNWWKADQCLRIDVAKKEQGSDDTTKYPSYYNEYNG